MVTVLIYKQGKLTKKSFISHLDLEPFSSGFFYLHNASGKTFYRHIELSGNVAYVERLNQ